MDFMELMDERKESEGEEDQEWKGSFSFNKILKSDRTPEERRRSVVVLAVGGDCSYRL